MKIRLSLAVLAFASLSSVSLFAEGPAPSAAPADSAAPSDAASPAAGTADFGDFKSSTLTSKAWAALQANNLDLVKAYTQKCISSFEKQALDMQKGITAPVDTSDKEKVFANWALNDVGTCYFILGSALEKSGDKRARSKPIRRSRRNSPTRNAGTPRVGSGRRPTRRKGRSRRSSSILFPRSYLTLGIVVPGEA